MSESLKREIKRLNIKWRAHSQKLRIGPVQPVLDPEPAVAGVELEVVEVVELRGEAEREVVARVVVDDLHLYETEPEPHQRNGTSHQQHPVTD